MNPAQHTDLPLQGLLNRLKREGFRFGVDTHLRIQRLLRVEGQALLDQPEKLKYLIGPVLVHSREEQQKFYQIFDEYLEEVQQYQRQYYHTNKQREADRTEDLKVVSRTSLLARLVPYVLGGAILLSLLILTFAGEKPHQFPQTKVSTQAPNKQASYQPTSREEGELTTSEFKGKMGDSFKFGLLPEEVEPQWPEGSQLIWEYEDGQRFIQDSLTAEHFRTFHEPGDFVVKMILRHPHDSTQTDLPEERIELATRIRIELYPEVTITPRQPKIGKDFDLSIRLGDSLSVDSFDVLWDFAGKRFLTDPNPSYRFKDTGKYHVHLNLVRRNPTGKTYLDSAQWSKTIEIGQERIPCTDSLTAKLQWKPKTPEQGREVLFEAMLPPNSSARDFQFLWSFGDKQSSTLREPAHVFQEAGNYAVRLTLTRRKKSGIPCQDQLSLEKKIEILSNQPPTILAVDRFPLHHDDSGSSVYRLTRWSIALLTVLASLLLLGLGLLIRYLSYRPVRPEDESRFQGGSEGPYTIPFPSQDHLIAAEKGLYDLANVMRQRREGNIRRINLPDSIRSTVRESGMPVVHFDTSSRPNEYLILIEQHHPESHLSRLFGRITEILAGEDVLLETFFYDNDPRNCWNEEYPDGLSLEQLSQRYRKHRLIVFTTGYHLIDPYESILLPWFVSDFAVWKENRLILTPTPVADWGYQEKLLMEEIDLLPLDIPAQMYMMEMFEEIGQPTFEEHKLRMLATFPGAAEGISQHDLDSVAGLKAYLGPDLFGWVAATAVYPQPTWEVTLAIGRELSQAASKQEEAYLLTFENLLKLARIPWLQTTVLPNRLREALLAELDETTERVARQTVLELMEEVELPPNSLAGQKLAIQETVNDFHLHPGDQEIATRMYYLMQEDRLGDAVLRKRLTQESKLLGGESGATHLRHRFGLLRPREYLLGGIVGLILISLFTSFLYSRYGKQSWPSPRLTEQGQVANVWVDKNFEQDEATFLHNQGIESALTSQYDSAELLIQQALSLRADYPLADSNLNHLFYAQGAESFNQNALDSALYFFQQTDSLRDKFSYLYSLGSQSLVHYYRDSLADAKAVFAQLYQLDPGYAYLEFPHLYRILIGGDQAPDSTLLLWNLAQTYRSQGNHANALILADSLLVKLYQDSLTSARETVSALTASLEPQKIRSWKAEVLKEMPALSFEQWVQLVGKSGGLTAGSQAVAMDSLNPNSAVFLSPAMDNLILSGRRIYGYTFAAETPGTRPLYVQSFDEEKGPFFLSNEPTPVIQNASSKQSFVYNTFYVLAKAVGTAQALLVSQQDGLPSLLPGTDPSQANTRVLGYLTPGGRKFQGQTSSGEAMVPTALTSTPDGSLLVGYENGKVRLYATSGIWIGKTDQASSTPIQQLVVSSNGKTFASVSTSSEVSIWSISGEKIRSFDASGSEVLSVAFSPDGRSILTGNMDNSVKLWDLKGQEIRTFSGHQAGVTSVAFSPDGQRILTGSLDNTAKYWDVNGYILATLPGDKGRISSVAFSPDGQQLLTGSWDFTAKLWDIQGNELMVFRGHKQPVIHAIFSPNGQQIATISSDRSVKVWNLDGTESASYPIGEGRSTLLPLIYTPVGGLVVFASGNRLTFERVPEPALPQLGEIPIPELIAVKGGLFEMGNEADPPITPKPFASPRHQVYVDGFEMGTYEITHAEYGAFMLATGYQIDPKSHAPITWKPEPNHPMTNLNWNDAVAYCDWLSELTGDTYRLPTEAEWEYAAQGGKNAQPTIFAGSNDLNAVGWYPGNSGKQTHPVGQKLPNELGFYDMTGNAYEWCLDWFGEGSYQRNLPQLVIPRNPHGLASGPNAVFRGGGHSWGFDTKGNQQPYHEITYRRGDGAKTMRYSDIGFRIVKGALPAESKLMTHTVKTGETIYAISRQYEIKVEVIRELNSLSGNILYSGQQLLIPYSDFSDLHPNSPLQVVSTQAELDSIGERRVLVKKMMVLSFWEPNNEACDQQITILEELAQSIGNAQSIDNKVFFGVVDASSSSTLPADYGVSVFPTSLILQGKKVIKTETDQSGLKGRLQDLIQKELAKANAPPVYSRATKLGPAGKDRCGGNGFYDPIEGGTCWTCPPGYSRTIEPISGNRACVK